MLAYNDLMAIGLIEGLDALGVRVPQEVSVVGIDDIALSRLHPAQADDGGHPHRGRRPGGRRHAAATDIVATARGAAVRCRHGADDRRTTAQVTLQTDLVIRDSTGPGSALAPADPGCAAVGRPPVTRSPPTPRSERTCTPQHPQRRRAGRARPPYRPPADARLCAAAAVLSPSRWPLGAAACGDDDGRAADPNAPVELSFFWWGGEARAKLTEEALDLYTKKHPNVTFKKTWQANQGYFDKLATLTAGGNAPGHLPDRRQLPRRVRGAATPRST